MLKGEKNEYRGAEYMITALGGGHRWEWAFYPQKDEGQAQRGEVIGTANQAEAACKRAIDTWRDGKISV